MFLLDIFKLRQYKKEIIELQDEKRNLNYTIIKMEKEITELKDKLKNKHKSELSESKFFKNFIKYTFSKANNNYEKHEKGKDFEQFLIKLFQADGYEVKVISKQNTNEKYKKDGGIDLIIRKNCQIAVQAKCHMLTGNRINHSIYREFVGAIQQYNLENNFKIEKGFIITTSTFSSDVQRAVRSNSNIELFDIMGLCKLIESIEPKISLDKVYNKINENRSTHICPNCNGILFESDKKDYFYCNNINCKIHKEQINKNELNDNIRSLRNVNYGKC